MRQNGNVLTPENGAMPNELAGEYVSHSQSSHRLRDSRALKGMIRMLAARLDCRVGVAGGVIFRA
eukprot:scaffold524099_cov31-Prasinocladus_malaysianus.AAC.1